MKIVLLYDFLLVEAGLERVMATQSKWLSKKHHVTASFATVDPKLRTFFPAPVTVAEHSNIFRNGTLKIMFTFLNLASIKKYRDVDLFISHSFICTRLAYYMKQHFGIPYVVYLHHPPNFLYWKGKKKEWSDDLGRKIAMLTGVLLGPWLRKNDKKVVRAADLTFVNSAYTQRRIQNIYGIKPMIVYPTLSPKFVLKEPKETNYILKKFNLNNYLICAGRLIPDKKYDWLIRAFSVIQDKTIPLVIVGKIKEDYKQELLSLATQLHCRDRIKFLGFVSDEDLVVLYSNAQAFTFPAPEEDFGLVPIEAMACGTPVVAWNDNAGPSETVLSEINGYLAQPYNFNDFAHKIDLVLQNNFSRRKVASTVKKFKEEEQMNLFVKEIGKIIH
ncbi:MAG: glycosyltransferase family 4 protein [Candidatus Nanoarchaeia archaeon]